MTAQEWVTQRVMTPDQWIAQLDAIIDRQVQVYPTEWIPWVMHRWVERQMQSIENLPPLLPPWLHHQLIRERGAESGMRQDDNGNTVIEP